MVRTKLSMLVKSCQSTRPVQTQLSHHQHAQHNINIINTKCLHEHPKGDKQTKGCVQLLIPLHVATQRVGPRCEPYLLRAFYERFKDNVEGVVVARKRVVRQARVRARYVRVVVAVARLPRRPRVAPRQRPALADQYVVVASMSLRIP